jgi:hypothetical protein
MTRTLLLAIFTLAFAGCAQLPPPPEDAAAKRFEPVPGKAVVYLARPPFDPSYIAPVVLGDEPIGSTYRNSFLRLELPPGQHVLRGMAGDSGSIRLNVSAGGIYYVQHNTFGYRSFVGSTYGLVEPEWGQSIVRGGQIAGLISR